ncbi:MAG: hypothetical protein FRX49_01123 [Trebouxia sp. A1-2]|nr:MAG: hypothetical protein FRX49_01123 [Trebouxia sp. A1-2]
MAGMIGGVYELHCLQGAIEQTWLERSDANSSKPRSHERAFSRACPARQGLANQVKSWQTPEVTETQWQDSSSAFDFPC